MFDGFFLPFLGPSQYKIIGGNVDVVSIRMKVL